MGALLSLRQPDSRRVAHFLNAAQQAPFDYSEVGQSCTGRAPGGYRVAHRRVCLGKGQGVFDTARQAMNQWAMLRVGWVEVVGAAPLPAAGQVVAIQARVAGLWWLNGCRVVYLIDEPGPQCRFGFANGTLPCHVAQGEERFLVEQDTQGNVWYDLFSFSRPRHPLMRLSYPYALHVQRQFGTDSTQAMLRAVQSC